MPSDQLWYPENRQPNNLGTVRTSGRGEESTCIIANYVRVTAVPDKLVVYKIKNSFVIEKAGKDIQRSLNRPKELKHIFLAAQGAGLHSLLASTIWGTDFQHLWTSSELTGQPSYTFTYVVDGGKSVSMCVTLEHDQTLTGINDALQRDEIQDLTQHLEGLNSILARPILNQSATGALTQLGANRFFLNDGFKDMLGLRALRGYFTSVRPGMSGTLLNVSTATTAFFPCCRVSDMLYFIGRNEDLRREVGRAGLERMLKGVSLRVAYKRTNPKKGENTGDTDTINSEKGRTKTFKQFGRAINIQKFYRYKDASDDRGRTVLEYFEAGKISYHISINQPLTQR